MESLDDVKHVEIDDYYVIPIETDYIKPYENLDKIIMPAKRLMEDGDYLVIAETPIAVSQGRLIDESRYEPSFTSKFLTTV